MLLQVAEAGEHFKGLAVACAVVLLAGTGVVFMLGETEILRSLSDNSLVVAHHKAIQILSDYAILYPFYVLFIGLWWLGRRVGDRRLVVIASGYWIAQLLGAMLTVRLLKMLCGRARPLAGAAPGTGTEWVGPTMDAAFHSFPSGHSADLITSAIFAAALLQRGWAAVPLFALAGLVGLTRVLLAKHYPTDVIGGAFVGSVVSLSVLYWYVLPRLRSLPRPPEP